MWVAIGVKLVRRPCTMMWRGIWFQEQSFRLQRANYDRIVCRKLGRVLPWKILKHGLGNAFQSASSVRHIGVNPVPISLIELVLCEPTTFITHCMVWFSACGAWDLSHETNGARFTHVFETCFFLFYGVGSYLLFNSINHVQIHPFPIKSGEMSGWKVNKKCMKIGWKLDENWINVPQNPKIPKGLDGNHIFFSSNGILAEKWIIFTWEVQNFHYHSLFRHRKSVASKCGLIWI